MILGLDLSTNITGLCVADHNLKKKKWYKTSAIITNKNASSIEKLSYIAERINTDYIEGMLLRLVVIEHPMARGHGKILLELLGITKFLLYRSGIPFIEVPPSTLKKFATGKGGAEKSVMVKTAFKEFGVDAETEDEVDAFWLAHFGQCYEGLKTKKFREEIIKKFIKKQK